LTRLAQRWVTIPMGIRLYGRQIARIIRAERCEAVVACSGGFDLLDIPAAHYASRLAGVRFYPYYFDDYALQWQGPNGWRPEVGRQVARRLEARFIADAAAVIVPNEFMADSLEQRYGCKTALVRNALDLASFEPSSDASEPRRGDIGADIRIVYTGAIYSAHYDSFRTLLAAIALLPGRNVKLHLYTAQSPEELAAQGILGPVTFHPHEAASAMPRIQRAADILFLPLALHSPYPELIRTAAPGKSGEYLASGRPILVQAPADSFVAWYFRKHDCGLVSDSSNPAMLVKHLQAILDDSALRQRLTANALQRAAMDFDLTRARRAFAGLLGVPLANAIETAPNAGAAA